MSLSLIDTAILSHFREFQKHENGSPMESDTAEGGKWLYKSTASEVENEDGEGEGGGGKMEGHGGDGGGGLRGLTNSCEQTAGRVSFVKISR